LPPATTNASPSLARYVRHGTPACQTWRAGSGVPGGNLEVGFRSGGTGEYNLTDAEADVAVLVPGGGSVRDVAVAGAAAGRI